MHSNFVQTTMHTLVSFQISPLHSETADNRQPSKTTAMPAQKLISIICCTAALTLPVGCGDGGTAKSPPEPTETKISEPENTVTEPTAEQTYDAAPEGEVLRHAVFFSFKDECTEDEVTTIVDAFRELPSKIPEIIDFQWGVNNSPEGLDDGFTHCFLLTFKDEAGRAVYLPHPAHKAFGKVLGDHNDQVFVLDYWGAAAQEPMDKELKHAVFFRFNKDASAESIAQVEKGFADLPSKIDAIKRFEWGTNNSPEKHAAGFTHCFMVSFDSEEGRAAYLPHADHQAFVAVLKPVLDAPRVLDFWVTE